MKHYILFILFFPSIALSQVNLEKTAARINSVQAANNYIKNQKNKDAAKLLTFNKTTDNSLLIDSLFYLKKGAFKIENTPKGKVLYKILNQKKIQLYNINIIEFDSNKTTIADINSLRSFILKGLKNKEHKFENLARVYSSHQSSKTGGNIGWALPGTFSKRFEKTVANKPVNHVFSFDEYRQRKHYVIKKTEENKAIDQITVLIITEH